MAEASAGLRHFWYEFDLPVGVDCPPGTREGVGVTAVDRREALDLVARRVFVGQTLPAIRLEVEDVEFHRLCPWLVLPNMVDPRPHGIWFPAGDRAGRRTWPSRRTAPNSDRDETGTGGVPRT